MILRARFGDSARQSRQRDRGRGRTAATTAHSLQRGRLRRRGDNGVSPRPARSVDAAARPVATSRPAAAALEWQDARLPLLGRLWADGVAAVDPAGGQPGGLVYLLQTSGVASTGYEIQRLQSERDDWQLRNEQLQLELAKRQSLTWIESEATGRLGMVRPEPTALLSARWRR